MVNQRVPHQGSKSELEDVIANIASEARALEVAQTTRNMNNVRWLEWHRWGYLEKSTHPPL